MKIRVVTSQDRDNVESIHLQAFPASENALVARLAVELLSETTKPATISLVAEAGDSAVGHVAFSPVTIDINENFQGYILGPLGVKPEYQQRRIGSKLIQYGLQQLSDMGVNVVFVYGDPAYYGRFGFSTDAAQDYTAPYKLQYPFGWQAVVLKEYGLKKLPVTINCVAALCDPELW